MSKVVVTFLNPILKSRRIFFAYMYGTQVFSGPLYPQTHASFVCANLAYKRSVVLAILNHFKGPNEPQRWQSPQRTVFLKTAETSTLFAFADFQSCWFYAMFLGGNSTKNWGGVQHEQSSLRWILSYFPVDFSFDLHKTIDGNIDPNPL